MAKSNWMIYGANGYTGALVAEEAVKRGHRPLLAGRSLEKLRPLAQRLGLETVALDLADGGALARALEPLELVFHAAGPFVDTSAAMIGACLAARTNYVDITGEVPVFVNTFSHDEAARRAGVLLLSGAGFDVVPTDCLARHVAAKLPDATALEIAIAGLAAYSPGTVKSMLRGGLEGGFVRRGGKLVPHAVGKGARRVRFTDKERTVMPIPWGDLETAYRTTGIPDITTYMAYPPRLAALAQATWPLTTAMTPVLKWILERGAIKDAIQRAIEARVKGPDEHALATGRSHVWVRASRGAESVEGWLETLGGYRFTVVAGVRCVEKTLAARPVGALTPALAFGPDLVLEIEETQRYDALPAR